MKLLDESEAVRLLEDAGVKATPQRVDIARILFARPQHLSADQILGQLRTMGQDCSRATVYNTLGLFERCGLVREVVVDPTRVFFDSTTTPHQHFYNVDTGELMDISADEVVLSHAPALPPGTEHAGTDVIIRVRQAR
jgi:Fur family iron response transcriptional regulator